MAFFGVQLNAQINRLNLQIKMHLSMNKHTPNFRTLYKGFFAFDKGLSGTVTFDQFEEVLAKNGIFLKKFEYQAYQKAFGNQGRISWFDFLGQLREPLIPQRLKLVENIFDSLDTEKKGVLHYTTLSKFIIYIVKSFNPKEFQQFKEGKKTKEILERQLLNMVNLDGSGQITKQQFINFYEDLNVNLPGDLAFTNYVSTMWNYAPEKQQKVKFYLNQYTQEELIATVKKIRFKLIQKTQGTHDQFLLKKVFDEFDSGQQGTLNPQDLFLMLIKLEIPIQRRLLDPVFSRFDRNTSGLIEFNEFKNFLFFDPFPI